MCMYAISEQLKVIRIFYKAMSNLRFTYFQLLTSESYRLIMPYFGVGLFYFHTIYCLKLCRCPMISGSRPFVGVVSYSLANSSSSKQISFYWLVEPQKFLFSVISCLSRWLFKSSLRSYKSLKIIKDSSMLFIKLSNYFSRVVLKSEK